MKADLLQFGSLLTWWWLPSLGSQLLLNGCYSVQILTPPSTPRTRNNHVQLARTAVIIGTLFYQLFQCASTAQPNYYQLLGLPLDVDSEGIRRSFRALARRYHPDKVGESGEAFFIHLRRAHDTLSEPVKRFAYDRFGPTISEWKDCESARDYMRRGLMSLVAFYTINPAMYALFGYFSSSGTRSDGISFWRLVCLFSLLAFEVCLLISPEYPTWMTILLPNTTVFDVRQLSHSLFVNFFFASLQLSAALDVLEYGDEGAPARDEKTKKILAERQMAAIRVKAQSLDQAAQMVRVEMMRAFAREVGPLRGKMSEDKKGKEEREMSKEEERLFERIDAVLLSKSLVQHNPQLLVLAEKPMNETANDMVKKEEQEQDSMAAPPVTVKDEPIEGTLPPEEATDTAQEGLPSHIVIKGEPNDGSIPIGAGETADAAGSTQAAPQESALESGTAEGPSLAQLANSGERDASGQPLSDQATTQDVSPAAADTDTLEGVAAGPVLSLDEPPSDGRVAEVTAEAPGDAATAVAETGQLESSDDVI
ncbi:DnaJ [Kalmanozyma brasiliensis GHG001]|uniref:J domain-containing protein n=1 Tax=Kalmanozyma brasiliensis (strain GHG001) TaxID=1365824 RepID=V5GU56_KALBG|nr:DnaJ [Kalmanozyma brasiliensis GHG001]EST09442.1 DnaJ [Kalmanozyma brasiliensis GHG001]